MAFKLVCCSVCRAQRSSSCPTTLSTTYTTTNALRGTPGAPPTSSRRPQTPSRPAVSVRPNTTMTMRRSMPPTTMPLPTREQARSTPATSSRATMATTT